MVRKIEKHEIDECANVIRTSFATVAKEFNLTRENCPTHTSFIENEKLYFQFEKGCPMFCYEKGDKIIGYFSLVPQGDSSIELNNLSVLPEYRHCGIGKEMVMFAAKTAKQMKAVKLKIGIVEESTQLKNWYTQLGFKHIGIHNFEHLPFTVGFLEKELI